MNPPRLQTRRDFLRGTLIGGATALTIPAFLQATLQSLFAAAEDSAVQPLNGRSDPILVVLQLAGGNDGLNTLIPLGNDHYRRARPLLSAAESDALALGETFALHPSLAGMKALHDEGLLAAIHGVGYPNPNRSHFRSMEIWQTASDSETFERHGWIGRYFDNACSGQEASVGIALGSQTPQAFAADTPKGITFADPRQYRRQENAAGAMPSMMMDEAAIQSEDVPDAHANAGGSIGGLGGLQPTSASPLDFLQRVELDAQVSSERIQRVIGSAANLVEYPRSRLGSELALVGKLIGGGMPTRVYYVSQGGYDTHTAQVGTHQRLLQDLGDALHAFLRDLQAQGNRERVLVMTFSEFGRRVRENASGGTDHGAAAPVFLCGGQVKPGLHGTFPSLAPEDLDRGDLRHTRDFRSIYATVLERHLRADSKAILGRAFPLVDGLI